MGKVMVHFVRPIVQQLVKSKSGKKLITSYVSQQYGTIAGTAIGVAISVAGGDYYGALTNVGRYFKGDKYPDRSPPFGYWEEQGNGGLNGTTNGSQQKALRTSKSTNRYGKYNRYDRCHKCCTDRRYQYRKRSSRR